jgi:hypothetical protein
MVIEDPRYIMYQIREKDPRGKKAGSLFDAAVASGQLKFRNYGHAHGNLKWAVQQVAIGPGNSGYREFTQEMLDGLIEREVKQWIKPQFRQGYTERLKAIARSAVSG